MIRNTITIGLGFIAITAFTISVFAQEPDDNSDIQTIETIVVTAQKRAQDVSQIPIAIDVISGDHLRAKGAASLIDIAQYSPGVNVRGPFGEFGYPIITLRGVNADGFIETFSQSTGIYTDGVYLSQPPMLALRLVDLERIEILKGPQGTIYGRSTIGGAVNFIAKKPTFENDGYITAGYSRYNRFTTEAAFGGPVSATVAARGAIKRIRQTSGPIKNLHPDNNHDGEIDQLFGRFSLLFTPTEEFDLSLQVNLGRDDSDVWPFALIPAGADTNNDGLPDVICNSYANGNVKAARANCLAADPFVTNTAYSAPSADDPYTINQNAIGQHKNRTLGFIGEMNWDLGAVILTSVTGWDDFERRDALDEDAGPTTAIDNVRRSDVRQFSQELRLASADDAAISWLTGLYYSDDELKGSPSFDSGGRQDYSVLETSTYGIFGQVEYPVTDTVKVTVGGRYTHVSRDFDYRTTSTFNTATELQEGASSDFSDGDYSYRLALDYQANDAVLLYTSIARGFNAGTFNSQFLNTTTDLLPTDSESIVAYEIGMKTALINGSAWLEIAVFYYDYSDVQIVAVEPSGTIDANVLTNAKGARLSGLEIQLLTKPLSWLEASFGVSYIDSEIKSLVTQISGAGIGSPDPYNAPIFGSSTVNLGGQPLPNHPNWSLNSFIQVTRPINSDWGFFAQADILYEDDIPRDLQATPALVSEEHWNLDARVGVLSSDEKWRIALWARNLTDETYITEAYQVNGFGFFISGANYNYPRTWGVSLTRNFQ